MTGKRMLALNQCILIMGVSGSGKTTIAKLLAQEIDGKFVDADDLHPISNIHKMKEGRPLTDSDRAPWLEQIASTIHDNNPMQTLIIACSAKKIIQGEINRRLYKLVYLKGSQSQISERLAIRENHFMSPTLLKSQFNDLEGPCDALTIPISNSPDKIVRIIISELMA